MSLEGKITATQKLQGKINRLEELRGYSAYEIALKNGFEGTEEEWLASLQGPKGDPGTALVTSVNGQTGAVTVDIPTKVSQLVNDSGFLTEETAPVYLVTINDANKAVESYAERLAAYQSGYVVQCDYLGTRLPLKAIVEMDFMFSGTIDGHSYHVVVRSNGNTIISERSLASEKDIPTKVSQLVNDSGFLTEETAPVTSVNGQTGAVTVDIPTKVSQLVNDSGFLTEEPVTTTKVSLTEQPDGSYLSSLTAAEIMADYKANKTVHCYHDRMILPLIHLVITGAVFSGIYDGQIQTVTVNSNKVATITATPISSGGGGADGITPHIGANGNWWIGEEDTGVSAGATDEQISGAVEEYMGDNPLVKTVNGTAPDENGNVELDIQSGGGGGSSSGGAFRLEMTLEEDVSDVQFLLPTNWANILQFHVRMDNEAYRIAADMKTYIICGNRWTEVATLPAQTLALDIYGIAYQRWGGDKRLFAIGVNSATNATDACQPVFPNNRQALADCDSNTLRIHSETVGVVFPAGAHFEVWGVYAS